jgi:prevent-host-death family protein
MSDSKTPHEHRRSPAPPATVREAAPVYGAAERRVPAAEFKTHCLRLLDDVAERRGEVVVTRHGKPVARLVAYDAEPPALLGWMAGSVLHAGDLVSPLDEPWDADS